jgi:energy-coupling factor transporter ATP-binding protein EcfA2
VAGVGAAREAADWAAEAEADCRSTRYVRCALQVNPFDYLERHDKTSGLLTEADYNSALIAACQENGIEAIAVTDHFRIRTSEGLLAAAKKAGIVAFPAIEAVSSDGVHLLILFEVGTTAARIERFIAKCDIPHGGEDSPIAEHDAVHLMDMAAQHGALCIAAHVAASGGLLKQLSGKTRIRAWRCPELIAVALPGPVADAPQAQRRILEDKSAEYRRERLPAVVNANDVSSPSALAKPSHSCWIKMSEISLRALRLAFLDHSSRVKLASDDPLAEHARLVAVRWEGGFLDGLSISLSEDLNVLIGGPGSGKSTVLESLRYALEVEPTGSRAAQDHEELIRSVVGTGATISVLVRHPRPSATSYVIERTVPNPAVVRKVEGGAQLDLSPEDLLPRPEIFGQHEVSEIAGDPQLRTALLERFRRVDHGRDQAVEELAADLTTNRRQILEIDEEIDRYDERLGALPRLEETLEQFRRAGVEDQLGDQSRLVSERQLLNEGADHLDPSVQLVEELAEALPPEAIPKPAKDDGRVAAKLARDLNEVLATRGKEAKRALKAVTEALAAAQADVTALGASWEKREAQVNRKLNRTLAKLKREEIDGEEFIQLRGQIEELRPLERKRKQCLKRRDKLATKRRKLLVEREKAHAAELRDLERAAKRASRSLGGRVRVSVDAEANRDALRELVAEAVSGRIKDAVDNIIAVGSVSPRALAEQIRKGEQALIEAYGITDAQAKKLAVIGEKFIMGIEELRFPTETTIELNLARHEEPDRWRPLERLSKGQKATAILLLLLLESDGPLIVDQPEDDLDNVFISEDVVPSIRSEKRSRQFLFATHNANIPVLGDAELIVGLTATGEAGDGHAEIKDKSIGSIDIESVRNLVEDRLEGGREAFELRREKYGV